MKTAKLKSITVWPKLVHFILGAKIGRYLSTFAAQAATWAAGHKGVNDIAPFITEYELTSALASTETLTLTLPAPYVNQGYVPVAICAWSIAVPQLPVFLPHTANSLSMTSYNRTTGVLICTAGSAGVADDVVVSVLWIPQTLGVA